MPNLLDLPSVIIQKEILPKVPKRTLGLFAVSCRAARNLSEEALKVARLLNFVSRGMENEARALLDEYKRELNNDEFMSLMRCEGQVTDNRRNFMHINALQYVFWTRNFVMLYMMKAYLPTEFVQQQLRSFSENKVTCMLNGKTLNETHFDFDPIYNLISLLVEDVEAGRIQGKNNLDDAWRYVVGEIKSSLPTYICLDNEIHEGNRCNSTDDPLPYLQWFKHAVNSRIKQINHEFEQFEQEILPSECSPRMGGS